MGVGEAPQSWGLPQSCQGAARIQHWVNFPSEHGDNSQIQKEKFIKFHSPLTS